MSNFIRIEYITYQRMNNIDNVCNGRGDFCTKLDRFLQVQLQWIYDQIERYPNSDYWHQVNRNKTKEKRN